MQRGHEESRESPIHFRRAFTRALRLVGRLDHLDVGLVGPLSHHEAHHLVDHLDVRRFEIALLEGDVGLCRAGMGLAFAALFGGEIKVLAHGLQELGLANAVTSSFANVMDVSLPGLGLDAAIRLDQQFSESAGTLMDGTNGCPWRAKQAFRIDFQ